MTDVEISSDGITVWVNTPAGSIARFGKNGIDIHTADTMGCLHCTHAPTTDADWSEFVAGMAEFHGVTVGEEHKPDRFKEQTR